MQRKYGRPRRRYRSGRARGVLALYAGCKGRGWKARRVRREAAQRGRSARRDGNYARRVRRLGSPVLWRGARSRPCRRWAGIWCRVDSRRKWSGHLIPLQNRRGEEAAARRGVHAREGGGDHAQGMVRSRVARLFASGGRGAVGVPSGGVLRRAGACVRAGRVSHGPALSCSCGRRCARSWSGTGAR